MRPENVYLAVFKLCLIAEATTSSEKLKIILVSDFPSPFNTF